MVKVTLTNLGFDLSRLLTLSLKANLLYNQELEQEHFMVKFYEMSNLVVFFRQ